MSDRDDAGGDRAPPAVAIVDAKTSGNVGTIARAMKNFGFEDLLLVDPPYLGRDSEAYGFAGHAREDVLPDARELTFDDLAAEFHTVGFTAITNEDATSHTRFPFRTPAELGESLADVDAPTALVFGRERVGLTNDELAQLDEVAAIPASADYPVMNLGQAATVALYELRDLAMSETQLPDVERAAPRRGSRTRAVLRARRRVPRRGRLPRGETREDDADAPPDARPHTPDGPRDQHRPRAAAARREPDRVTVRSTTHESPWGCRPVLP